MDVVPALLDKSLLLNCVPGQAKPLRVRRTVFRDVPEHSRIRHGPARCEWPWRCGRSAPRHGTHFAAFGTNEAVETLFRHGGLKRLRALAHEVDNLVVACRRAIESAHGETAVGAYRAAWGVLQLSGPFSLAVELGAQVLALERIAPATRAAAHQTPGLALARLGRTDSVAIVQFGYRALPTARRASPGRQGDSRSRRDAAATAEDR